MFFNFNDKNKTKFSKYINSIDFILSKLKKYF